MNLKFQLKMLTLTALSLLGAARVQAQWLTQANVLKPGWNAVYLLVDASSQSLDSLVGFNPGCPIDQLWQWKTLPSTAQYITTPASPLSGGNQWLTYYRPGSGLVSSLAGLSPNAAYLVHSSATTNYTWLVQGQPVPPKYLWDNTGLNLIGFATPAGSPPTFQKFLAPAPALAAGVQIYQYLGGGFGPLNPEPVFSQYTTLVTSGQAYWVSDTNLNNTYFGPFTLGLPTPGGLNFGTDNGQFTVQLQNVTTNPLTITATLLPSEAPPYGQPAIVDVPPMLVEGSLNASNLTYAYSTLAANGTYSWTLAAAGRPGSQVAVVLGVNRFALTGSAGALYAGVLQFTDSLGLSALNVAVSANTANNAGLWVGSASVTQVGQYLKTYATNTTGAYQFAVVTNATYLTNAAVLRGTNLAVHAFVSTNLAITDYTVTNLTISTYVSNSLAFTTNGSVPYTNALIQTYTVNNSTLTTLVIGVTFDAGGNPIWQTVTTTNSTTTSQSATNWLAGFTSIAVVSSNATPVVVTNLVLNYLTVTNVTTTNGPLASPATTTIISSSVTTNRLLSTNLAFNVVVSTPLTSITTATNLAVSRYATTNAAVNFTATTNYFATSHPVYVVTNGINWILVTLQTNFNAVTNYSSLGLITNLVVLSNNYVWQTGSTAYTYTGSTTNLIASVQNPGANVLAGSFTNSVVLGFLSTNAAQVVTATLTPATNSSYAISSLQTNLGAVPTAYPLRLIVFNDGVNSSLLQRVYYGLRQQTNIVVATTENVLDVATLNTARRISSSMMPWTAANQPWPFTGSLIQGGVLTTTLTENYDDQAANPFLHTYHPDHNNLNYANNPPSELPVGSESYNIRRTITLSILPNTMDFLTLTTGNSKLGGAYNETITLTGLGGATRTYNTAGGFLLTRISPVATLTTQ